MAFTPKNSVTPTKVSRNVNLSPSTKGIVCLLCGNEVGVSSNRRKLFRGDLRTDICVKVERLLDITIIQECATNIICRKCQDNVDRAKSIISKLKTSYFNTIERLYDTRGTESIKRLRPDDSDLKQSRRKTLFPCTPDATSACVFNKENSDIQVSIANPVPIKVTHSLTPLLAALKTTDFKYISTAALDVKDIREEILSSIINQIRGELVSLCGKAQPSILRKHDKEDILKLAWEDIVAEWKLKAPLYWSFLEVFVSNPSLNRNKDKNAQSLIPGLVTAGSKLISLFNQQLSLIQHINSVVLLQGGAKKSLFKRLNATHDSLSYDTTINKVEQLASDWSDGITIWKRKCELDHRIELLFVDNVSSIKQDILEHGSTPDKILILAAEQEALDRHRKTMHEGYYFVGDNVDFYTHVRHMSFDKQNVSQHMFQMCCYKNRVSGNNLQDVTPKGDIKTVKFSKFVPDATEQDTLTSEFVYFVMKIWANHIPSFQCFLPVLPKFIPHEHLQDTKKKTERIPLGVLQKNEQYNDQMTDIAEFLHKFVPGHTDDLTDTTSPQKVLSGGDYLTFERQKWSSHALGDGPTPSSRLKGLVPKMEEFHNQAEFLKVIWKHLYSATSNKSVGTLHSARSTINAVNVPTDPHGHFYACADFMDKVTTAYIITGGLHHFKMASLSAQPSPSYSGAVGHGPDMLAFFKSHAKQFVEEHVLPVVPQLPEYGPQSNTLTCRYCDKRYQRPKPLRKHEARVHGHSDPIYNPPDSVVSSSSSSSSSSKPSESSIYDYTRLCLTLGLLRLNHNDAIHMGDGARMMRLAKWFCLYYKGSQCPKYAYGLLETQAQAQVLLSERQSHRLIWNRTVNHQGKADTNHPNDLDLEHCNRAFKDGVHTYKGRYTDKTILRVSRSSLAMSAVCKRYDKIAFCKQSAGKHGSTDFTTDIIKLVEQFNSHDLFNKEQPHPEFKNVRDPMSSLYMNEIQSWMSESLKVFGTRTYYEI